MTNLDKFISRYEYWAEDESISENIRKEHRQLAEWLKELKRLRKQNSKETIKLIPYLMHKEMGVSILKCQKAYDIAIDYLRSQGKLKG